MHGHAVVTAIVFHFLCSTAHYNYVPYITEKGDWVGDCTTKRLDRYFVRCYCNHLSLFGVLVVSIHALYTWTDTLIVELMHLYLEFKWITSFGVFCCRIQILLFVQQASSQMKIDQSACVSISCLVHNIGSQYTTQTDNDYHIACTCMNAIVNYYFQ